MNPKTISSRNAMSFIALAMASAFLISTLGCASLVSKPPAEAPIGKTGPSYKVIFGTAKGKSPKIYNGQIDGNLTVQQALEQSGATSKFKFMTVNLARRLDTGRVLKLTVDMDSKTGKVVEEQNYAVLEGDEILVRRETPGMFSSVLKGLPSSGR